MFICILYISLAVPYVVFDTLGNYGFPMFVIGFSPTWVNFYWFHTGVVDFPKTCSAFITFLVVLNRVVCVFHIFSYNFHRIVEFPIVVIGFSFI